MRCDECGFENFADAEFCAECGKGIGGTTAFTSQKAESADLGFVASDLPATRSPFVSPPAAPPAAGAAVTEASDDFIFEPSPRFPSALQHDAGDPGGFQDPEARDGVGADDPVPVPPEPSRIGFEPSPPDLDPVPSPGSFEPSPLGRPAPPPAAMTGATTTADDRERRRPRTCSLCTETFDPSELRPIGRASHCPECGPYLRVELPVTRDRPRPAARRAPSEPWSGPASAPSYAPPDNRPAALREANPVDGAGRFGVAPPRRSRLGPVVLVVLALFMAGGAVGLWWVLSRDRIDKLLAAADESGETFELVARYASGDSYRYRLDVRMDLLAANGGETFGLDATIGANLYLDVLGVDSAGVGDVQISFDTVEGEGEITVDGQRKPLPSGLVPDADRVFRSRLDSRGQPVAEEGRGLTGSPMFGQGLARFPAEQVRVGDTWTQTMNLDSDSSGPTPMADMVFEITYELRGVARHRGQDCVVLELRGEREEEAAGMRVQFELKGVLFVDRETGAVVTAAIDMEGSGTGSEGSIELSISSDLNQL